MTFWLSIKLWFIIHFLQPLAEWCVGEENVRAELSKIAEKVITEGRRRSFKSDAVLNIQTERVMDMLRRRGLHV